MFSSSLNKNQVNGTASTRQQDQKKSYMSGASIVQSAKNVAERFATKKLPSKVLIDGKWVSAKSGETFDVEDPALGKVIAQIPKCGADEAEQAIRAARRTFDEGPWHNEFSPYERGKVLHKIGDLILENIDEFAYLESIDNGKPMAVARAADCTLSAACFHYYAGMATKVYGLSVPVSMQPKDAFQAFTRKEPIGVVGAIVPWNFPLQMVSYKLPAALCVGNSVVLKPAEQTPLSALRLGEIMEEAGLPPGVVNIIAGEPKEIGKTLGESKLVDKIAFTGSTPTGKLLLQQSASNLKRITLELGGKSPNIVFADAIQNQEDYDKVVQSCAEAIFFNMGQCCTAGSRLYLEEPIAEKVVQGIRKYAEGLQIGKGTEEGTQMGPLISKGQLERVLSYVEDGKKQGGEVITGGNHVGDQGYFMKPTIITNVKEDMKVVQEEIFGPVLVVEKFNGFEEIKKKSNNVDFGLAAAVWSRDIKKAHTLANNIAAGTVWINSYNVFDPAGPFGGFKQSGWGRELGPTEIDHYTESKTVYSNIQQ